MVAAQLRAREIDVPPQQAVHVLPRAERADERPPDHHAGRGRHVARRPVPIVHDGVGRGGGDGREGRQIAGARVHLVRGAGVDGQDGERIAVDARHEREEFIRPFQAEARLKREPARSHLVAPRRKQTLQHVGRAEEARAASAPADHRERTPRVQVRPGEAPRLQPLQKIPQRARVLRDDLRDEREAGRRRKRGEVGEHPVVDAQTGVRGDERREGARETRFADRFGERRAEGADRHAAQGRKPEFRLRVRRHGAAAPPASPRMRSAREVRRARTTFVSMACFTAQGEPMTRTSFLPRVIAV